MNYNNDTIYKYYGNYDKNIKAIKGGGVIVPSNPPNREKTTETINSTWKKNIKPINPLFKSKHYSDPNLTNGYLNQNNYVTPDENISDYYYPSQKINKVFILDNDDTLEQNIVNNLDPIKLPPPLINTKNKKYKKNKKDKLNSIDNNLNLTTDDLNLIDFIKNNSLYDGKFIYTVENKPTNNDADKFDKLIYIPFINKSSSNNNNDHKNDSNDIFDDGSNNGSNNDSNNDFNNDFNNNSDNNSDNNFNNSNNQYHGIDSFQNIEYSNNFNSISNTVLLVIFSILLIIYFSKYQK